MIAYRSRLAFWSGVVAVSTGVVLHLPMYVGAADMGYLLAGMPIDTTMVTGMVLILAGFGIATYGLIPSGTGEARREQAMRLRVSTLDDAPLRRSHVLLLLVMAAAVTIDIMKPTTLAFVVPGMAEEYGLRSPLNPDGGVPVAVFPLVALIGMVIGSALWGWLGDMVGRRASILMAASCSSGRPSAGRCRRSPGTC